MLIIIGSVVAIGIVLGICAIAGCILSGQNSRRLEKRQSQEFHPPLASGF